MAKPTTEPKPATKTLSGDDLRRILQEVSESATFLGERARMDGEDVDARRLRTVERLADQLVEALALDEVADEAEIEL